MGASSAVLVAIAAGLLLSADVGVGGAEVMSAARVDTIVAAAPVEGVQADASDVDAPLIEEAEPSDLGGGILPAAIDITRVGVSTKVVPVGLEADQTLTVPEPSDAGWYSDGVPPGALGTSVIAGHVDSYRGPAVFFRLKDLLPGDEIVVRDASGTALTFVVEDVERQPKEALATARVWRSTERPMLVLITCGGRFDKKDRKYAENILVYAGLREEAPAADEPPGADSSGRLVGHPQ